MSDPIVASSNGRDTGDLESADEAGASEAPAQAETRAAAGDETTSTEPRPAPGERAPAGDAATAGAASPLLSARAQPAGGAGGAGVAGVAGARGEPAAPPAAPAPPAPTFDVLPLSNELRETLAEIGYVHPTPVQLAVWEPATRGRDAVVQARTGTGKTAAFGLPMVDHIVKRSNPHVQVLALCPTRELALQVAAEIERLGKRKGVKVAAVYGGAPMQRQIDALSGGAQVVVGTPGRVLDHLRRGTLVPKHIRLLVLDESDEMLSMGFERELNAILAELPPERQTLLFSATVPPDIERMAKQKLKNPEFVTLSSDAVGALSIQHSVYLVTGDKPSTLIRILEVENPESAIVFCNTRDETESLTGTLKRHGYDADWLNGDLEQSDREKVMRATREGRLRFLVATDVAARGIDISHLTHVINYDFPQDAESYVHRTGRTGRAGRTGTAISLITPQDVGPLYILRLTYKIRPLERQIPTEGELKTRAEADLVTMLAEAFLPKGTHPDDLSLARRLLSHDQADVIVAGLLRDHLGARPTAREEAGAARRATQPRPQAPEARAAQGSAAQGGAAQQGAFGAPGGATGGDRDRRDRDRDRRPPVREARPTVRVEERPAARPEARAEERVERVEAREAQVEERVERVEARVERVEARVEAQAAPAGGREVRQAAPVIAAPEEERGAAKLGRESGSRELSGPDTERSRERGLREREGERRDREGERRERRSLRSEDTSTRRRAAEGREEPPASVEPATRPEPALRPLDRARLVDEAAAEQRSARPERGGAGEAPPSGRSAGATPGPRRPQAQRPPERAYTRHSDFTTWQPPEEGDDDEPILSEAGHAAGHAAPRGEAASEGSGAEGGGEFAEVYVNVGRRDGARAGDFQRVLVERAEVNKDDVGRIRVRERNAFVSVRRSELGRALEALNGATIAGREAHAEVARGRSGADAEEAPSPTDAS